MVKLLVIADDFTGALDTGIQFAKRGIRTQIFTKYKLDQSEVKPDSEILVIDTESRPMSKTAAYEVVKAAAEWAVSQGISLIFKKTDSALRGNIGSELQAAVDAALSEPLFFLPGYPEIERITVGGIQYIQGELLADSVFGKDPFEPVKQSYIPDIIQEQSDIPVVCLKNDETIPPHTSRTKGIVVCDTVTPEDIDRRLEELIVRDDLKVIAGCAALADRLVDKLDFSRTKVKTYTQTSGMYVACGSLNKITQEQVEFAVNKGGFARKHLTIDQKLNSTYYQTPQGKKFLEDILTLCRRNKRLIVDSFDMDENKEAFLSSHNISGTDARLLVAQAHGYIVKALLNQQLDTTILMTGGDTLMGYMNVLGCTQIEPVCEIEQGVVLSRLEWNGFSQQVLSKSGGFGTPDILCKIAAKIIKENA